MFRRQLRDAAASLPVGDAWDPSSRITPLTQPPGDALRRALTTLDEGEEWLLEPRQLGGDERLWSPGIKLGVRRGSFFHRTECFGPVLGLMRAEDSGRGDRPGQRHAVRAHERDPVARRPRGRPLGRAPRGRQPLRESAHHRGHRRAPALRRLEGLVGGAGRQGRRAELRAAARALAAGGAARRRRRVLAAGRGRCSALPGDDGRRCGGGGRPRRRAQPAMRAAWREALRVRARPERAPRGRQRVPLPPVPRDHGARRSIAGRAAARALAGVLAALTADVPLTLSLPRGEPWPWLERAAGNVTAVDRKRGRQLMERLRDGRPRAAARPRRRSHSTCAPRPTKRG